MAVAIGVPRRGRSSRGVACSVFLVVVALVLSPAMGQLSVGFYANTCPSVFEMVREEVKAAVSSEPRMGASLLRLVFHDCFVNGCDAGLLLDDGGEKETPPNQPVRGYEVIDNIKAKMNAACGANTVSCADIVAIAARDPVVELGGPSYSVPLGRQDSRHGSPGATRDLPSFSGSLDNLIGKFSAKGFSPREMVALSGAHTIGKARCATFRDRIYNDNNIDPFIQMKLQAQCQRGQDQGDGDNLAPLDESTPETFDNHYFHYVIKWRAVLHSDQELFVNGETSTSPVVNLYSNDSGAFFTDFANAMEKMGNLLPYPGTQLEVRENCRRPS